MCGIAGAIDWQNKLESKYNIFEDMQNTLLRRGPDQKGIYVDSPAALIHTRLSVVDLDHGQQPMELKYGGETFVLIYNGELYNTEDLREELLRCDHHFIGHSDTEVLLHAYIQWGESCIDRFNGIFAFALWERNKKRLFLARDRIGVKPLFYYLQNNLFLFGSEIKTLLAHPAVEPVIDTKSIAEIMLIGPGRTPGYGVFQNISELPPATCGYYDKSGLKVRRYWKMKDRVHTDSFSETVEKVRFLVLDAINRQLVSDVPVGTFLSGGLDSSIISSVADHYFKERGIKLQTFSVEYKDNIKFFQSSKFQPDSDESYIARMNQYLNAQHHRVILDSDDLVNALFDAVDARDLPGMADVDSSLLLFCKKIKNHVTVALSGECADEIFGGYPWYRDKEIRERYGFPWAQTTAYRQSFLNNEFSGAINADAYVDERYRDTIAECSISPDTTEDERRMKEMVNLNLNWFMQTLLDRKDRMSMYNGLEVRVPFCDYRIAEYLYGVPWDYKDYNDTEKGLLRMAMRDILPKEVLWRKKSPYPKTHNPSYMAAVSAKLQSVIDNNDSPLLRIVKKDALQELIQSDNPIPWYGQLMTTPQTVAYFLQIDYWLKKYKIRIV
jgi:asparagine synthase (glutamine-hydrolysing)